MAKNYAIAIGINHYDCIRPLKYAANDAKNVRDFLVNEAGFDTVFHYSDDSPDIDGASTCPTRSNLERLLEVTFQEPFMGDGDNFWFFFSGHGTRENGTDYLIPSDAFPENIQRSGIAVNYIIQRLKRCGADNIVLILDACREQGNDSSKSIQGMGKQTEENARQNGVISIRSCSEHEYSWELEELQQGAFTHALLEGLGSKGRKATVEQLNEYLKYTVPQLTQHKGRQTPSVMADPLEKSHLILMPQYATKTDISNLKNDAYKAQINKNFEQAEQLWIRVLETGMDIDAVLALQQIAIEKTGTPVEPEPEIELKSEVTNFEFTVATLIDTGNFWRWGSSPQISYNQDCSRQLIENIGDGVSLEMVLIPGGQFTMGSIESSDEQPQHQVTVQPFFISKYPITQLQWKVIVTQVPTIRHNLDSNPSQFGGENRPVESISWLDAIEFCARLSQKTGQTYRLPSEAEWEYACRSRTTTRYSFGDKIIKELANYNGNIKETTNVGVYFANHFGLYDMHGNVWEWCADPWHENYEGAPSDGNVWDENNDNRYQIYSNENLTNLLQDDRSRVLRGGSWSDEPKKCRSVYRNWGNPSVIKSRIGFRVVLA